MPMVRHDDDDDDKPHPNNAEITLMEKKLFCF